MIKSEEGNCELIGTIPEVVTDFVVVLWEFKKVLSKKLGEEKATEIMKLIEEEVKENERTNLC